MREPVFSGQFYESSKEDLGRQIESCFKNKLGAGKLVKNNTSEKVFAAIVPHAGYVFSGYCATHVYASLMNTKEPITFIILGTNHTGLANAPFSVSFEDFQTPLGTIKNETSLSQQLINNKDIIQDEAPHKLEHSIEVQLPFLQYCFKNFSIVPIIVSTDNYLELKKFSRILAELIKKQKNSVVLIASSDFTHYGPNYNFIPFPLNKKTKQNLYSLDHQAIEKIISFDSKGFYEQAEKSTICGKSPITITIETSKILGAKKAKLLKYYTSGDIVHDYENSVGYASLIFS
jgi:MEMO1 family protein